MTTENNVMRHFKDKFESISLLIEGISIDSIAEFDLETCREDETVGDVLKRMRQMGIDQMPVSPERTHYIAREGLEQLGAETPIRETVKKPIDPPLLLAGGTSLLEAYPLFKEEAFLFLLRGNRVEGIATRGDFQRAPFRIYLFGLLSLLEMGMTRLVLEVYGDQDWKSLPGAEDAVKEAERWYNPAKNRGEEPRTQFEVVGLAKKLDVLKGADRALERFNEEHRQLILTINPESVKTLRDNLAHAKDLTNGFQPRRWEQVFELAQHLQVLTKVVTAT